MTTLEFMEKELSKCRINLAQQKLRGAPEDNIMNIEKKIEYYSEVCELLKKRDKLCGM